MVVNRAEAVAAVTEATAERDTIQANLLDLDASFGKRMLAGATLTGQSQRRWATAEAQLAALWELFGVYSAVLDQAARLAGSLGRSADAALAAIDRLLHGPSVELDQAQAPLGVRELTSTNSVSLTCTAAVTRMREAYSEAGAVCAAAQSVWDEIADGLQQAGVQLDETTRQATALSGGLENSGTLAGAIGAARANLDALRQTMNTDPLSLWSGGTVDTARLTQLTAQVADVAAQVAAVDQARAQAGPRIAALATVVTAARDAWQDAATAQARCTSRIAGARPQPLPDVRALTTRLDALGDLQAAGRWSRLAAELDALDKEAAVTTAHCRDIERAAAAQLGRRDELRGLLDAYRAKAALRGAAEDPALEDLHGQARTLLWTAPCDLTAAAAAVTRYQQAVLALDGQARHSQGQPS